jgi:hypothetical protein
MKLTIMRALYFLIILTTVISFFLDFEMMRSDVLLIQKASGRITQHRIFKNISRILIFLTGFPNLSGEIALDGI